MGKPDEPTAAAKVTADIGAGKEGEGVSKAVVWDQRYTGAPVTAPMAAQVLRDYQHLLPTTGQALDLACGLGGNARLLAAAGLRVQAWDISAVAIEALNAAAVAGGLALSAKVRDIDAEPPEPRSFDVIVVSHYLQRDLAAPLMAALRPGGLLFYQTFTRERVDDSGPRNPDFRLALNELLQLFDGLLLRAYREEGQLGDPTKGFRNEAMLVAQRPAEQSRP